MPTSFHLVTELKKQLSNEFTSPIYLKLADCLKQFIYDGHLPAGTYLPSERDLSAQLNISRITVRKALEKLSRDRLLLRDQGRGTYINEQIEYSLEAAPGFSQQIVLKGKRPDSLWISKVRIKAEKDIADMLAIAAQSEVYLFKRIRYVDGQEVSFEQSYIPVNLIGDPDDIQLSLYDYLRSRNIFPDKSRSWVTAKNADAQIQQLLKLTDNSPLLVIRQLTYNRDGQPIEYSINSCRSDMYVFTVEG